MRKEQYQALAEMEDELWYFEALNRRISVPLLKRLSLGDRVLDVGCGTGGLLRHLIGLDRSWKLTGVDVSPEACRYASERTPVGIEVASVTSLPFGDEAFEAVLAADVLCQVKDEALALSEMSRVLRPNGLLVINVPAYSWLWSYHDVICETHKRYNARELARVVAESNFQILALSHANMFALPFIAAKRKWFPDQDGRSDVRRYPKPVNQLFRLLGFLDQIMLRFFKSLPLGSSVFLVAIKRA
jgi:ubiquinone/menaquinone biosynthesis C-methylase UbiE